MYYIEFKKRSPQDDCCNCLPIFILSYDSFKWRHPIAYMHNKTSHTWTCSIKKVNVVFELKCNSLCSNTVDTGTEGMSCDSFHIDPIVTTLIAEKLYMIMALSVYMYFTIALSVYMYFTIALSVYIYFTIEQSVYIYFTIEQSVYIYSTIE